MVIFICDAINLAWGDRMVITRNISLITLLISEGSFRSDLLLIIYRPDVDGAVLQTGLSLTDFVNISSRIFEIIPGLHH